MTLQGSCMHTGGIRQTRASVQCADEIWLGTDARAPTPDRNCDASVTPRQCSLVQLPQSFPLLNGLKQGLPCEGA